jgi:ribosomal protein S20
MKIFKDLISGDELFSDSFPVELVDDVVYVVTSKMVVKDTEGNFDIGANPSQEGGEEDEGVDASTRVTVNAVVDAARLQQTTFDKKAYMAYIKTYMKVLSDKIKEANPERVPEFQKKAQTFVKKVLDNFKDYDFFTGESMNLEAMVPLMFYKEDGITPGFYFFKDLISGDELFSDSFPVELVDDVVYLVTSKMVVKDMQGNFDIGANPSQEGGEEDEGFDDASKVTVNAVVDAARLQQTTYDKKAYMAYIKSYMKVLSDKIKETNPERVPEFQKKAQTFVKKVLDNFQDYDFYTGESMNLEAMVPLMFYKEDGITPCFYFFKDGLIEEKV